MPPMDEAFQLSITVATFTLHNFIRLYELGILIFQEVEEMETRADYNLYDIQRKKAMNRIRDKITKDIWKSDRGVVEDDTEEEDDENDDDEALED